MENKASIEFTDEQKGLIRTTNQALNDQTKWTISITKEEIKQDRILSIDDLAQMPTAYGYIDQYRRLFPSDEEIVEFKKDIDAHEFVSECIRFEEDRLRRLKDTEIRLRQEIDSFARYARDRFETEEKRKPEYKTASDFFKSIFNKKLGKR